MARSARSLFDLRYALHRFARVMPRAGAGSLMVALTLFMMACTDYGQLGCDGHCNHPWDGQVGSCPLPGAAEGQPGGACQGWPSPACDVGRCVDGTCLGCGADGQVCCTEGTSLVCNQGTCAASDDYAKCNDSCGLLEAGKNTCCPGTGTKCSQGVCDVNTNTCIQPASDPCTGKYEYFVALVDAYGCAIGPFYFTSDSDAEAQTCADQLKTAEGAAGLCALNTQPQVTDVCGASILLGAWPYEIAVCDQAKFSSCEQSQCTNCSFTTGACP